MSSELSLRTITAIRTDNGHSASIKHSTITKIRELHLLSKVPVLINSSISSLVGGSATEGTGFETPLGTQEIADIISSSSFFKTWLSLNCCV